MAMKELFSKDYNGRKIVFYQDGQSWTWKSEGLEGGVFDSLSAAVKDAVNASEVKIEESAGSDVEFEKLFLAYEIPGLIEIPENLDVDGFDNDSEFAGFDIIDIVADKKVWVASEIYNTGEFFGITDYNVIKDKVIKIAKEYFNVEISRNDFDDQNLVLIGQTEDKANKVVKEVCIKVIDYDTEEVVGVSQGFTAIDFINITDDVMLTRYQVGDFGEMPIVDDPIFAIIEKPSVLKESGEIAYVGDGGKHDGKQIMEEGTHKGYAWYTFVYGTKPLDFGLRIYDEDGQEVFFKREAVFPALASELTVDMDRDGILLCNFLPVLHGLAPKLIDLDIKNIKEYGDQLANTICDIIAEVTGEPVSVVGEDQTGSADVMTFDVLSNAFERIVLDDVPVIKKHIKERFGVDLDKEDVTCWEDEGSEASESHTVVIDIHRDKFKELDESAKENEKMWFAEGNEVVLQMPETGNNRDFAENLFMKTHTLPNSFNSIDGCVMFRYPAEECNGVFFEEIKKLGFIEKKPHMNESTDEQTIFDMDSEIYTANYKEGHDGGITFVIMRKMNGQYCVEDLSDTLIRTAGKIVDKIEEVIGYENFFGSIDVENTIYCDGEGAFHVIVGLFEIDDDFGEKENLDVEIVGKMEKLGFAERMKGDYIKFDYFTK